MTIRWPSAKSDVHGVSSRSTRSAWSRLRKCRWLLRVSAPGSRPASQSTWKPVQMPSTGRPGRAPNRLPPRLAEHREAVPDAEHGPALPRPVDDVLHQGRAGRDRPGAQVVTVGEAAGEDDGVDVLEVVVGVPQGHGLAPGQAHRAGGVDVVQGTREGDDTDAHSGSLRSGGLLLGRLVTRTACYSDGRCSSTSSMTGLASSVSAICFSSASSGVPTTSSTECLPWRTLRTPSWPSRPSAPSTA